MSIKRFILDRFVSADVRQWLRLRKRDVTSRLFPYEARTITRTCGGMEYRAHIADAMGEAWYAWGEEGVDYPLQPEIAFLQNHALQPGALVFDLGAHQSVVAVLLAKIVGPAGTVVSVEATPFNVAIGEQNKALNDLDNLHVMNAAVSDRTGHIEFVPADNGSVSKSGGGLASIRVPACTIDELAERHGVPDVLFIDVEGFELHALRGAATVLGSRPDCFVEVHTQGGLEEYGGSVAGIISVFEALDYELFFSTGSSDDTHTFEPLGAQATPTERFFLIAIGRDR